MRFAQAVATLFAAATLMTAAKPASDPIAVYAIVDSVVFAPSAESPTIRIWGAFSIAASSGGDIYRPALRGYLYYTMDKANERIILAEWNDLKSVAGTREIVGFGARYGLAGAAAQASLRVRCAAEVPRAPDTYTTGFGVVKGIGGGRFNNNMGSEVERDLLSGRAPAAPCPPSKG